MRHRLELTPASLHGCFAGDLPPALTLDSGDEVEASTLDAWWGRAPFPFEFGPRDEFPHGPDAGHALTGPIAVRGLAPGEVLQVEVLELVPGSYGFTEAGGHAGHLNRALACDSPPPRMLLWELDHARGTATTTNTPRPYTVRMAPFLGVMGMPPAAPGRHPTTPPRPTGGNLDCRLLTAGSMLLLPVEAPGGLLSFGDGHAAQGDGEISNNGIECAMQRVRLRLTRRTGPPLPGPVIRTPRAWAVLGLGDTLDAAAEQAARGMLDLMQRELGCSRNEALALASVAVHLHITQLVNGTRGVHALWETAAIAPGPIAR